MTFISLAKSSYFDGAILIEVNTHEAKSQLSRLIAAVKTKHEQVRICRNGKPVALLISVDAVKSDPLK